MALTEEDKVWIIEQLTKVETGGPLFESRMDMDTSLVVHDFTQATPRKRFLRRPQVEEMTGLSRSTIYRKMEQGAFPRPVHLSKSCVRWLEADVLKWMDEISYQAAARRDTESLADRVAKLEGGS